MKKGNQGTRARLKKPKYVPHLYFHPKAALEKQDKSLLLWSENGSDHKLLLKMLKDDAFFHAFCFGETGSGKSNTLEVVAEYYKNEHRKLIIDASGNDFEGAFWAKKYKCYFVYPQLMTNRKKNENPNVVEYKLNKKNTWDKILKRAIRHNKVVVLMCEDPLERSYLKALEQLFRTLLNRKYTETPKLCLLREISFFGYQHGTLKLSTAKIATQVKRRFLKYVRTGRIRNNQILCDAQRIGDVDKMIGDNVAVKIIKRSDGFVGNFQKHIQDQVKKLDVEQCIFQVKGKMCTGTIGLSSFHKEPEETIEKDLKVYPREIDIQHYNKLVENRYIDRVGEHYTNVLDRAVLARRRHLQDPENSELCQFEIADLLAIDSEIVLNGSIKLKRPSLVYGEVKFRSPGSSHPRIETGDVKKTISDLAVKKINFDLEKDMYFWTIDKDIAMQLGWEMDSKAVRLPVLVEMISPQGATKGARSLMKKHHIWNRKIPIDEETFYD